MVYSFISYKTLEAWITNGWRFLFNPRKSIQYYAEAQLGCPVAYTYSQNELKDLFSSYGELKLYKIPYNFYLIYLYILK